jgi:hypothetical protein
MAYFSVDKDTYKKYLNKKFGGVMWENNIMQDRNVREQKRELKE